MCAIAYAVLVRSLISHRKENQLLAEAIGTDRKGNLSLGLYLLGIALAFVNAWIGFAVYATVALIWLIPDRRLEQRLIDEQRRCKAG